MSSVSKLVAAGTTLALVGLLLGSVSVQAEADEDEWTEVVFFHGEIDWGARTGACIQIGPGPGGCSLAYSVEWDVSNHRLAGEGTADTTGPFGGGARGPHEGTIRIENALGTWNGVLAPRGEFTDHYGVWLVGEGGYEGLTAFAYATDVSFDEEGRGMRWTVDGWLFEPHQLIPRGEAFDSLDVTEPEG